ncbi:hypothetical protein C1637_20250 [Chryseobacterium lactis]|uniref:Uncharacterized protein n=1 Tax=Chryseobacterium lactis TaxID=1241981 RepID=A0A3G6RDD5_CHRLC|nr:hypothetical protein [Chryseobacterium lactis]AZA82719.1 hypothetical protein EG342_12910 [Chryseobacterium lactis]AZB03101.1 hypothetical protein EG341_03775 [Chryseobacterium lactis]PNW11760.1 hypothetical protein C1637_20250 [Chryseobacterium lactis]
MDHTFYLEKLRLAAAEVAEEKPDYNGLKLSVDIVLESAALKMYKPEWSSNPQSPIDAAGRIFFSIWISDKTLSEKKICYNIHALKLRELKAYKIAARNFAQDFRDEFLKYQEDWPNISVKYGPLTLMEGWVELNEDNIPQAVAQLIRKFLKINSIVDTVLIQYKK